MDLYSGLKTIAVFTVLELALSYFITIPEISLVSRILIGIVGIVIAMLMSDFIFGLGNRLIGVPIILAILEILINLYREYVTIPHLAIWQKTVIAGIVGALSVFISNFLTIGPIVV